MPWWNSFVGYSWCYSLTRRLSEERYRRLDGQKHEGPKKAERALMWFFGSEVSWLCEELIHRTTIYLTALETHLLPWQRLRQQQQQYHLLKVKVTDTWYMAPLLEKMSTQKRFGMAHVVSGSHSLPLRRLSTNGMNHTYICLPSRSWSSFTDPGWMEGWVDLQALPWWVNSLPRTATWRKSQLLAVKTHLTKHLNCRVYRSVELLTSRAMSHDANHWSTESPNLLAGS